MWKLHVIAFAKTIVYENWLNMEKKYLDTWPIHDAQIFF